MTWISKWPQNNCLTHYVFIIFFSSFWLPHHHYHHSHLINDTATELRQKLSTPPGHRPTIPHPKQITRTNHCTSVYRALYHPLTASSASPKSSRRNGKPTNAPVATKNFSTAFESKVEFKSTTTFVSFSKINSLCIDNERRRVQSQSRGVGSHDRQFRVVAESMQPQICICFCGRAKETSCIKGSGKCARRHWPWQDIRIKIWRWGHRRINMKTTRSHVSFNWHSPTGEKNFFLLFFLRFYGVDGTKWREMVTRKPSLTHPIKRFALLIIHFIQCWSTIWNKFSYACFWCSSHLCIFRHGETLFTEIVAESREKVNSMSIN